MKKSTFGFIVVLLGLIGGVAGFGASFTQPEQWRAEVEIQQPSMDLLGNYFSLHSMYQQLTNSESKMPLNEQVYEQFKQNAQAFDRINTFWQDSEFYKQRQTGITERDNALLQQLIENTQFMQGNPTKQIPDRIRLTLDNPKQAAELLGAFVQQVNLDSKKALYNELIFQWKTLFQHIQLAAQHDNEQPQWKAKLNMMKSVSPLDNTLQAFNYIKSPTQPQSSQVDRTLWASIGAAIGLLIGLLIALVLANRKREHGKI